jgi:tRNA modification GTPase
VQKTADTIAAIATPPGIGGISVVRVSGPAVAAIARQVIVDLPSPRRASLRSFRAPDASLLDEGVAIYFPAPASYTGEDVLELQGHGGAVVAGEVLRSVVAAGARPARPGEFSERAFLGGRLDLAQAEAVADLINSATAVAARAAMRSLKGEFSKEIAVFNDKLEELRAYIEAAIDFPEEEIDFLSEGDVGRRLRQANCNLAILQNGTAQGALLASGIQVALAGRPNVGKSSLLNRLAGHDRAIVSDIAGTTRDVIHVTTQIDGLRVELVDTAGLREGGDEIEAEGIRRARHAVDEADLILLIVDDECETADEIAQSVAELPTGTAAVVVRNKCDLSGRPAGPVSTCAQDTVSVSARTGAGMGALKRSITNGVGYRIDAEEPVMVRQRHIEAMASAQAHLRSAEQHAVQGLGELIAEDLRLSQRALGEITGTVTSEDLLGRIFASFCIGK